MKVLSKETDRHPIKAWVEGVEVEEAAVQQLRNISNLPFIHRWVAAMPDMHTGIGATVGSVIATKNAIIPAASGVDLGCGLNAIRLPLTASQLPDNLSELRSAIEQAVPHGRTNNGAAGDRGAWGDVPAEAQRYWTLNYGERPNLAEGYRAICEKHPQLERGNLVNHLGTLGTGNHFIELCLDQEQQVWLMLHSGSRGPGNRIGSFFIEKAKQEMDRFFIHLPDKDLAYLPEGSRYFDDYIEAVHWAQQFARLNRQVMVELALATIRRTLQRPGLEPTDQVISCHHNYISRESHYNENVWVTRKGACRARKGDLVIIPGSMGTKSYIARGKGNLESFHSCSHGAGRRMSRTEARRRFTIEDHVAATEGVNCRKDAEVLDETPGAYKDVDKVMSAQSELVEVLFTLKQVLCIKG